MFFRSLVSVILVVGILLFPAFVFAQDTGVPPAADTFYKAVVISEPEEEFFVEFGIGTLIQRLDAKIISGDREGEIVSVTYEIPEGQSGAARLNVKDKIIVGHRVHPEEQFYLSDIYRLPALYLFIGLFLLAVVITTGRKTIQSLVGLVVSFLIILYYIVPSIATGSSPVTVAVIGTTVIATLSIFIAHGWHPRTGVAYVSTLATVFLAIGLSAWSVSLLSLFGWGTEEAFFLQYSNGQIFDLRGILIAGMTIGVLGILDDITTAQAAVVEQLHYANRSLSVVELYRRGSEVGREHIISLVNTLALAYTGASLPLLLMFEQQQTPAWLVVNSELLMEEIVRIIVGSIVLVLAVPITTFIAAYYFGRIQKEGAMPSSSEHTHVH